MGCDHAVSPSAWRNLSERHTWWLMELLLIVKVSVTPSASRGPFGWQQWPHHGIFNSRRCSHLGGFLMARIHVRKHGRKKWRHVCNSIGDSWWSRRGFPAMWSVASFPGHWPPTVVLDTAKKFVVTVNNNMVSCYRNRMGFAPGNFRTP